MRAIVTGAAGFIGSNLCASLLDAGEDVVGIDCLTDYYPPERKRANLEPLRGRARFELHEQDLCEVDLAAILQPGDLVFHLAAQPGVRRSWGSEFEVYTTQNVLATQRLLEAAREVGVARIVYASSSSIYGDAESYPTSELATPRPISPYGVTKLAGEHLCMLYQQKFEVPTVALRYFTVYGPGQRPDMAFSRFIDSALEGSPITVFGDGNQVRDFTFVGDVVRATIAAARVGTEGRVYNVAGGAETTVLEVIETLREVLGRPVEIDHRPPVPGDAWRTGADTARAREELGYEPTVSLQRGLELQVEALGLRSPR